MRRGMYEGPLSKPGQFRLKLCLGCCYGTCDGSHKPPDELIQTKLKQFVLDTFTTLVLDWCEGVLDHCEENRDVSMKSSGSSA